MKKIVYFGHQTAIGGGERSLLQLIDNINREEFNPIVIVTGEGEFYNEIKKRNLDILFLDMDKELIANSVETINEYSNTKKVNTFINLLKVARVLRRKLDRINPDIIHTNTLKAGLITLLATINTSKYNHIYHDRTYTFNIANKVLLKKVNKIIAISDFVKSKYKSDSKVMRIYNGVDYKEYRKISETTIHEEFNVKKGSICIGVVGRVVPWKGQDTFIDAAIKVIKKRPSLSLKFFIIGSSEIGHSNNYEEQLLDKIKRENMLDKFIFTGYRRDVINLMKNLDIIVAPSKEPEPFGRVIIETQMAKKVVIGTNIGGMPELIVDNETGFLFPPNDSEMLSEIIEKLIDHNNLRKKISENGYYNAKRHFSIEKHVSKVEVLYKEILNEL